MMTKSTFTLVVALVAGAAFAAGATDALAKGKGAGRKNKAETVRLARPTGGADTNAKGTITITHGRAGDDAVLHLKGLARRTSYQIVDSATGDVLGRVRANAKGRATFDLTPGVGPRSKRAASADGANGSDGTTIPDVVDVVDPDTGDTVLTGDTTGDLQALYGYATYGNATETVSVEMGSDPTVDTQYFSFTYTMPSADYEISSGTYQFFADTSSGDDLPLGASSVLDLAGKDFQVRDADGKVAFKGSLPDVEAYEITDPELPDCPGNGGDHGDWGDWNQDDGDWGNWGGDWTFPVYDAQGSNFSRFAMGALFGGRMKGGVRVDPSTDPVVDPALPEFTLWLETADGFVKVADLTDAYGGWDDEWESDWDDEWNDDWEDDWSDDWSDDWTWEDGSGWSDNPVLDVPGAGQNNARGARGRGRGRGRGR